MTPLACSCRFSTLLNYKCLAFLSGTPLSPSILNPCCLSFILSINLAALSQLFLLSLIFLRPLVFQCSLIFLICSKSRAYLTSLPALIFPISSTYLICLLFLNSLIFQLFLIFPFFLFFLFFLVFRFFLVFLCFQVFLVCLPSISPGVFHLFLELYQLSQFNPTFPFLQKENQFIPSTQIDFDDENSSQHKFSKHFQYI